MAGMQAGLPRRIEGFDLLRGIGATTVFLFHATQPFPSVRLFDHGYLAVDLFFMLSGHVLATTFGGPLANRSLGVFAYLRLRLAKLYPLLAVSVLTAAAIGYAVGSPAIGVMEVTLELLLIPGVATGFAFALNPAEWSMLAEFVVNLGHALVAPLLTTPRLIVLAAGLGLTFVVLVLDHGGADIGSSSHNVGSGLVRAGFGFAIGLLLARAPRRRTGGTLSALLAIGVAVGVILLCGLLHDRTGLLDLGAIATFPLVLHTIGGTEANGVLRRLGREGARMSYPLYILHYPLLLLAQANLQASPDGAADIAVYVLVATLIFVGLVFGGGLMARLRQALAGGAQRRLASQGH